MWYMMVTRALWVVRAESSQPAVGVYTSFHVLGLLFQGTRTLGTWLH